MKSELKQCPNGHYYYGANCPHCKTGNNNAGAGTSLKTDLYPDDSREISQLLPSAKTQGYGGDESKPTELIGERKTDMGNRREENVIPPSNRTVFVETEIVETDEGKKIEKKVIRKNRKLVGWLVTFSHDAMGIDFKLYEGRNTIGRMGCNITLDDPQMTSKHATILFQDGEYFLKDEFSTHGTLVMQHFSIDVYT